MTPRDLDGWPVLVNAGPTREHLDPVRFLSNPSSGRMGYAVAEAAAARGAQVELVSGPSVLADPAGVVVTRVTTADEMLAACGERFEGCRAFVAVAAVSDFRPRRPALEKRPKEEVSLTLELERTPDVLATLAADKGDRLVVGFAAQTGDPIAAARRKLEAKGLDLIVANDVSEEGAGFEVETNRVIVLGADGFERRLGPARKLEIAHGIWDAIVAARNRD